MKDNVNKIQLTDPRRGNYVRADYLNEPLDKAGLMPKTVVYKDIDTEFKKWAENLTLIGEDGNEFPTLTLYSNQRFSEYSQSWEFLDKNNNLLLNFKTVSRDNKPEKGTIHGNIFNIPGDQYFTMLNKRVLDDNGTESYLSMKMKMPTAVDITYKFSVFTVKYETLNTFNEKLNEMFNAIQHYITPNGHYMPMSLEGFDDITEYNIDDRQYYGQTANIKVKAYIITDDDYKIEEIPLKKSVTLSFGEKIRLKMAKVEIEDKNIVEEITIDDKKKFYQPIILKITFRKGQTKAKFNIDTDFTVTEIEKRNILSIKSSKINGNSVKIDENTVFRNEDEIKMTVKTWNVGEESVIIFKGYDHNRIFDKKSEAEEMMAIETDMVVEENQYND